MPNDVVDAVHRLAAASGRRAYHSPTKMAIS